MFIDLQQRLSTGADDEAAALVALRWPTARDDVGQLVGAGKTSAVGRHADEVRVAERAHCRRAILLATRPGIAAGKATEHHLPPRMKSFARQDEDDFLYGVVRSLPPARLLQRQPPTAAAPT